MQQFDGSDGTDGVHVKHLGIKAKARLSHVLGGQNERGNCFCRRGEFHRDQSGRIVAVAIFGDQRVRRVGKQIGQTCRVGIDVSNLFFPAVEGECGDLLVCKRLIPKEFEIDLRGGNLQIFKQDGGFGGEGLDVQDVESHACSVQLVIIRADGILVGRVWHQTVKGDVGDLRGGNLIDGKHVLAVIDHRIELSLALGDQVERVGDADVEADVEEINTLTKENGSGLTVGGNARAHRLVAFHANVLDGGSVNVFDGVDGIFHHTFGVADVDLENQIFHVRAFLEHIGRILFAVEGE